MRHQDAKVGGVYGVRIKGRLTPVRLDAGHYDKREFLGWTATVVATGEAVIIDRRDRLSRLKNSAAKRS